MVSTALTKIDLPGLRPFKTGKVRHVYDLGDTLLMVTSDRVSAFDCILPDGIPGKGEVLTHISEFWFRKMAGLCDHHLIATDVDAFPAETAPYKEVLRGRSMWVKKTELIEIECVVRGYIIGTGWKEYQQNGQVCGIALPAGLRLADELPEPLFTPAIKAASGHDENVSFERTAQIIGQKLAEELREKSLVIYKAARKYAAERGIILADTKFEFGILNGKVIVIDEMLTPDSSRYWAADSYRPGISPPSFDKQIVRDYLETSGWDKQPPAPHLPVSVIERAAARYKEIDRILTGG